MFLDCGSGKLGFDSAFWTAVLVLEFEIMLLDCGSGKFTGV